MMNRSRWFLGFLLANALLALFVFRGALWGSSLLAPLDIAPSLFSKYRALDPKAPETPWNHYIIDQLTYDLPLQYTIHDSLRSGVVPWWDPYTYGGRPFLADAHISGTDPIRVLTHLVLPFELAYNWARVLHFLLAGIGMYLVLRRLKFAASHAALLALTWEFAGFQARLFGHPWLEAVSLCYPWLWLAWTKAIHENLLLNTAASGLMVAWAFYAGNLQSHAYVVLFAFAFLLGHGWGSKVQFLRTLVAVGISGGAGAALAAPVILGQIDLFAHGVRLVEPIDSRFAWLSGLISLSAVFPWACGTFRTIDIGRLFSISGLGFHLFIGSAGFVLAMRGVFKARQQPPGRAEAWRTAVCLVFLYLVVILSTPLLNVFYTRCAALGVFGLILLAAFGVDKLAQCQSDESICGKRVLVLSAAVILAVNVGALLVYPRLLPKLQAKAVRDSQNIALDEAPTLRLAQLSRLPEETSLRNPETLAAAVGLLGLGYVMLLRDPNLLRNGLFVVLVLNLLPVAMFCARFVPRHDRAVWEQMKKGGPEQIRVARLLGNSPRRLLETAPGVHEQVFPNSLSHLWQVRTVHGYAALQPKSIFRLTPEVRAQNANAVADFTYESPTRGLEKGALTSRSTTSLARFHWREPNGKRSIAARDIDLNTQELEIGPGEAATLVWSDSYDPGWSASTKNSPLNIAPTPPCFSEIPIPAGQQTIRLTYRPRFLRYGLMLAGIASGLLLAMAVSSSCRAKKAATIPS